MNRTPMVTEVEHFAKLAAKDEIIEEARTLLQRTSQALDYMENRGFSSQRALACDVMAFRRRMKWAPEPGREQPV